MDWLLGEVILVVSGVVDDMMTDVFVLIAALVTVYGPVELGDVGQLASSSPLKQSRWPSQSDLRNP